ncbi:PadR family transcriptional regulator [Novosphingopyxis sp.]|uniref:PadR family transcriptional regulator n=1 Tax=Novosphingopyxis sp. TaxID=2709690 RepID=UPI003B5978C1
MRQGCGEFGRGGGARKFAGIMAMVRDMAAASGLDESSGPHGPFGPQGPFGPGGPFGGGRGRRRGRVFGSGELRLALLRLIADEPRHGYQLIKAIEELSGGTYAPSPGAVYPTLSLLEDEGAVRELCAAEDEPRKAFEATAAGREELDRRAEEAAAVLARVGALGEEQRAAPNRQLHRAMENLRNALRVHRHGDRLDQQLVEQVVDIVDEAARRIERL